MMKEEGAQALNYGEPQGYRGLRELVCHKYALFEGLKVTPENIIVSNGSGHALVARLQRVRGHGRRDHHRGPTFSGTLNTIRRHGPQVIDVPVDDRAWSPRWRASTWRAPEAGPALQADLHHRQLPEPVRPDPDAEAARGAGRAGPRVRHADPGGRRLRRAPLRGRAPAVALRARPNGRVIRAGTLSKILGAASGSAGSARRRR